MITPLVMHNGLSQWFIKNVFLINGDYGKKGINHFINIKSRLNCLDLLGCRNVVPQRGGAS